MGALIAALVVGCSSGGSGQSGTIGGGGAAGTAADAQSLCTAICNHQTQCGTAAPTCNTDCLQQLGAPAKYRQDFLQAYATCVDKADCSTNTDDCTLTAANQVAPDWQQDADRQSCENRYNECQNSFVDDICGSVALMTASGRQQVADCLSKPCDQISACLDAIP